MKFQCYTLGCKVNQYETQAMEQQLLALSLSAMQVGNICGIDFMAHGPQVCHCEEAVGRRGNLGKALPIGTDHHQNATRRLRLPMALIERPVQGHSNEEGTGAPQHHPDVSLRGAKRRGNLGKALAARTSHRRPHAVL